MVESKVIVIGHKNPDTDSCAAALGYANLKQQLGIKNVIAASAGYASARTEFLFKKFNISLPEVIEDVSLRVSDVMNTAPIVLHKGQTLLEAMEYLKESQMSRIPVTTDGGEFIGMVSLFDLAGKMLQKGRGSGLDDDASLVGRTVETSLSLAAKTLNARITSLACDENEILEHHVYVGAMSIERLEEEVLATGVSDLVVVVGDRRNIHKALIESKIRMLVVTGNASVDLQLIKDAKENGTSILQTSFDSATTIRRLKFSQPVESMLQDSITVFKPSDKVSDISRTINSKLAENYPVCDEDNHLIGVITKLNIDQEPPIKLVMVDHNELDQAVKGAEEVEIIEIMDHHRIGITPTAKPITVTNDVVGSTSTLVCEQFRKFGIEPAPDVAGILMGGVATDTLLLRSPTSTERDRIAIEYLEKISGVNARELLNEIFNVGSVIANESAFDIIRQDKKNYKTNQYKFSVSQVEESGFENYYEKEEELLQEINNIIEKEGLDFAALLVTDVVQEDSLLVAVGSSKLVSALPFTKKATGLYELPGILSRKKQLLPTLLKVFESI